jgi:hypothetical protein
MCVFVSVRVFRYSFVWRLDAAAHSGPVDTRQFSLSTRVEFFGLLGGFLAFVWIVVAAAMTLFCDDELQTCAFESLEALACDLTVWDRPARGDGRVPALSRQHAVEFGGSTRTQSLGCA